MQTKLELITRRARENPKMRFTSLAHHLGEGFLLECFQELKKDKAPGVDGVTVGKYEERLEENLRELVVRLKGKKYRPQPVRRVHTEGWEGSKTSWDTHDRRQDSTDGDKEDS